MNTSIRLDGLRSSDAELYIKNPIYKTITRLIVTICCLILTVFGLSICIGWMGHIESFIRYSPGSVATVFNTGICFVMLALAILSIVYNHKKSAKIMLLLVSIFLLLTLLQSYLNIDLMLDQLFMTAYDTEMNPNPGRLAPIINILLLMITISLSFTLEPLKPFKDGLIVAGAINKIIFICSILLFMFHMGYIGSEQSMDFITGNIPVSGVAVSGIIGLSFTSIVLIWNRLFVYEGSLLKHWLTVVGIFIFICTMILSVKIGEYNSALKITSNLPVIVLIVGTLFSLFISLLMFWLQKYVALNKSANLSTSVMLATFESMDDGVLVITLSGAIITFNTHFRRLLNISNEQMLNFNLDSLLEIEKKDTSNTDIELNSLFANLTDLRPDHMKSQMLSFKDGKFVECHLSSHVLNGAVIGAVLIFKDVTIQHNLKIQLVHQSTYDPVTMLPNQALSIESTALAINSAKASHTMAGIYIININNIAEIKGMFGAENLNQLLKEIAGRLTINSPEASILGRMSEYVFILINDRMINKLSAALVIARLQNAFKDTYAISGENLKITCSIGAAIYPIDGLEQDSLIGHAEVALSQVMKRSDASYQFYSTDINEYSIEHISIGALLNNAIETDGLIVYYQPVLDLKTKRPVGVEALVRMKDLAGNILLPGKFIEIAEHLGLIEHLGRAVMLKACTQLKIWNDKEFPDLYVSINVSPHQFASNSIHPLIDEAIQKSGINPANLGIEILESTLIYNPDQVSNVLKELRMKKIKILLDDFGTGFSSYSYISKFPIDTIKIDRSFVEIAVNRAEGKSIVTAIISMAKALNYTSLIEGVETLEQAELFAGLGCDEVQGFYYARPMPADECEKYLMSFKK